MKHLQIFENYNPTQHQQDAIRENNKTWYSEMIYDENGIYVGGSSVENHTIEKLVSNYIEQKKYNDSKSVAIIVENKKRILSEEEIEQLYQTNKYNL